MSEWCKPTVKVLLAERDQSSREILNQYFEDQGWSYDAVGDAPGLFSALQSQKYDLVVTDLRMPDLQGIELLRKIKEHRPSQALVVVTDDTLAEEAGECMRSITALDILHRPLHPEAIAGVLGRIVEALRVHTGAITGEAEKSAEIVFPYLREYTFTSKEFDAQKLKLPVLKYLLQSEKIELNTALRLELAYQEAVTNALEHGNLELESSWKEEVDGNGSDRYSAIKQQRLQDPAFADRKISIEVQCVENLLTITIRDEGKGFPLDIGPAVEGVPDDINCHGRGLTIINSVMDRVTYTEGGSVVRMEKTLIEN